MAEEMMSKIGGKGSNITEPMAAGGAGEDMARIGGEEKRDAERGGESGAVEAVLEKKRVEVGKEGGTEGGSGGAVEEIVEFIAHRCWGGGGRRAEGARSVGIGAIMAEVEVAVGGKEVSLGTETKEGDGGVEGEEAEIEGGLKEVGPLDVGRT